MRGDRSLAKLAEAAKEDRRKREVSDRVSFPRWALEVDCEAVGFSPSSRRPPRKTDASKRVVGDRVSVPRRGRRLIARR